MLAGSGQVGNAELTLALIDPARPFDEDVSEAIFWLGLLEGWVGNQVLSTLDASNQGQQERDGEHALEQSERRLSGLVWEGQSSGYCKHLGDLGWSIRWQAWVSDKQVLAPGTL